MIFSSLALVSATAASASASAPPAAVLLKPPVFERLPVGSIRPTGWLAQQLGLAAEGYTGYLCDWYGLCANSTFLGGDPTSAASESPNPEVFGYWLNGAVPLSFQVDNEHLSAVIKRVVDHVLEHTQPDGLFGVPLIEEPQCTVKKSGNKTCRAPRFDNGTLYWSKSLVVYGLIQYAEGNTSDARTVPALERHFRALGHHLHDTPPAMWGASRWVEAAIGMQWMLDRGLGGHELLEALHSLRNQSVVQYPWQERWLDDSGVWESFDFTNLTEKEVCNPAYE